MASCGTTRNEIKDDKKEERHHRFNIQRKDKSSTTLQFVCRSATKSQKPSKQRTGPRHNLNKSAAHEQKEGSFVFLSGNQEVETNGVDVELLLMRQVTSMSTIATSEHGNTSTVDEAIKVVEEGRRSSLINGYTPPATSSSSANADKTEKIGNDVDTDDNNDLDGQEPLPTENKTELEIQIPLGSPPKGGATTSENKPTIPSSPKTSLPSSPSSSPAKGGTKRRSLILHGESYIDQLQQAQEQNELESATVKKNDDADNNDKDGSDDDENDDNAATPLALREAFHAILDKKQKSGTSTPTSVNNEVIPDSVAAAVSRTLKSLRGGIGMDALDMPETDSPLALDEEVAGEGNKPGGGPKRKRTISFSNSTKDGGGGSRRGSTHDPTTPGGRRQSRNRNSNNDPRRSSKDQLVASVAARMQAITADTVSRSRRSSMNMLLAVTAT